MQLSDCVSLSVSKPTSELSEIEDYLIHTLVREWKNSWDRITNISHKGNVRLSQYLSDNALTTELMSEKLRTMIPYGMIQAQRAYENQA